MEGFSITADVVEPQLISGADIFPGIPVQMQNIMEAGQSIVLHSLQETRH